MKINNGNDKKSLHDSYVNYYGSRKLIWTGCWDLDGEGRKLWAGDGYSCNQFYVSDGQISSTWTIQNNYWCSILHDVVSNPV